MTSRVDRPLQQHRQQRRKRNGSIGGSILFLALALHFASNLVAFCSARDCHTSFRRAWRDLTCQEQDDFLDAIITVKDSGAYDEFIRVHLSVATRTHGPAEFLPWHRYVASVRFHVDNFRCVGFILCLAWVSLSVGISVSTFLVFSL